MVQCQHSLRLNDRHDKAWKKTSLYVTRPMHSKRESPGGPKPDIIVFPSLSFCSSHCAEWNFTSRLLHRSFLLHVLSAVHAEKSAVHRHAPSQHGLAKATENFERERRKYQQHHVVDRTAELVTPSMHVADVTVRRVSVWLIGWSATAHDKKQPLTLESTTRGRALDCGNNRKPSQLESLQALACAVRGERRISSQHVCTVKRFVKRWAGRENCCISESSVELWLDSSDGALTVYMCNVWYCPVERAFSSVVASRQLQGLFGFKVQWQSASSSHGCLLNTTYFVCAFCVWTVFCFGQHVPVFRRQSKGTHYALHNEFCVRVCVYMCVRARVGVFVCLFWNHNRPFKVYFHCAWDML